MPAPVFVAPEVSSAHRGYLRARRVPSWDSPGSSEDRGFYEALGGFRRKPGVRPGASQGGTRARPQQNHHALPKSRT